MTVIILDDRPSDHRAVPLLTEPEVGHYPEFRAFLVRSFRLAEDRVGPPGLLSVDGRPYELVFTARSGQLFPAGVEVNALVPGLEPLDGPVADRDVWAILGWLVAGVGGEWRVEDLVTTGRIYRIPAATAEPAAPARSVGRQALVFDLYATLVDPLAIAGELERAMSPADAQRVAMVWRRVQLEYAIRLTAMGRYQTFSWVTARALDHALAETGIGLGPAERATALQRYDEPVAFPDAVPALRELARRGHRMALLSNGDPAMLDRAMTSSGLRAVLPTVISVDAVRAFKPHPAVYRHAAMTLDIPIGEIRLISSNPFDVIGAREAGMSAAWVNRSGRAFDAIAEPPDITVASLTELVPALNPAQRRG